MSHRHRTGGLSVPGALDGVVTAVLGPGRPAAGRRALSAELGRPAGGERRATPRSQLGRDLRLPAGHRRLGPDVAIIELGGGFEQSDLDAYFARPRPLRRPASARSASTARPTCPGQDPHGADGEVLLDIEVVGALAPEADIVVYFAPNTDAGFLDAVTTAAHATPTPAAISISWGQSEDQWTAQARTAMDEAFADAAALGVTVTAAAGDNGSSRRADRAAARTSTSRRPARTCWPAAAPRCTPTRPPATVTSETVWNDGSSGGATGGGVSDAFPVPAWQQAVGVPDRSGSAARAATGRGVPDVAGDADPQTGYQVRVDGNDLVIGGTSAVAPLWAALVARLAQATGRRLGLLQPALYAAARGRPGRPPGFRDITVGDNGAYSAGRRLGRVHRSRRAERSGPVGPVHLGLSPDPPGAGQPDGTVGPVLLLVDLAGLGQLATRGDEAAEREQHAEREDQRAHHVDLRRHAATGALGRGVHPQREGLVSSRC